MLEETDLGRVKVGMPCRISFDAYTNWVWSGTLSKIYPQGDDGSAAQNFGGGGNGASGTRFPIDIAINLSSAKQEEDRFGAGGAQALGAGWSGRGGGGGGRRRSPLGGRSGGNAGGASTAGSENAEEKPSQKEEPAPTPTLLPNLTASVELVLEDHPDVLVIPAQYVKYEEGQPYVEVVPSPEDQAKRERRDVELGFSDGLRYELKSGVEEGETVILERAIKEEPRRF
jgi:hypothetical protein